MSNSIGARLVHWHLFVCALEELYEVYRAINSHEWANVERYEQALYNGIPAAMALIKQESWDDAMSAYPTTRKKLTELEGYWMHRHQTGINDQKFQANNLRELLTMTAMTQHFTTMGRIELRFAAE
jgi:hypothetical protein